MSDNKINDPAKMTIGDFIKTLPATALWGVPGAIIAGAILFFQLGITFGEVEPTSSGASSDLTARIASNPPASPKTLAEQRPESAFPESPPHEPLPPTPHISELNSGVNSDIASVEITVQSLLDGLNKSKSILNPDERDTALLSIGCQALRNGGQEAAEVVDKVSRSLSTSRSSEAWVLRNAARPPVSAGRPRADWEAICKQFI